MLFMSHFVVRHISRETKFESLETDGEEKNELT